MEGLLVGKGGAEGSLGKGGAKGSVAGAVSSLVGAVGSLVGDNCSCVGAEARFHPDRGPVEGGNKGSCA